MPLDRRPPRRTTAALAAVRGEPDPKPAPRIVNPQAGIEKLRREGRCRACGDRAGYRGRRYVAPGQIEYVRYVKLTRHHLIPKGQGGDDVDANLIPVCGDGTTGCHGGLEHSVEARRQLRPKLRPEEVAYAIEKVGAGRFDARYPP